MGESENSLRADGFTLVEIAIVLIVIGLVVGGVLFGRDLVGAATIRSQISQIEKYQQAVNTFRGKYGYLPGDIKDPDATNLDLFPEDAMRGKGTETALWKAYWAMPLA